MAASKRDAQELVAKLTADFAEDSQHHDRFVEKAERGYRAYEGQFERRSRTARWDDPITPRYAGQIIETMVASLIDPKPKWRLRATCRLDSSPDLQRLRKGARGLEILLSAQRREALSLADQRAHRLQALCTGLTAMKTGWAFSEQERPFNRTVMETVFDDFGLPVGEIPRVERASRVEVVKDDPTAEVVDMRHLLWPKNAVSWDKANRLTHRLFLSFDEIKRRECKANNGKFHDGPCEGGIYHEVDRLKETKGQAEGQDHGSRSVFRAVPDKNDVELLEIWKRDPDGSIRLCALGNKTVLLRDQKSPFWHGEFPFILCSGMPQPFQVPGVSDIEMIEQLQEMMWTLGNQRLLNLELVNNAIILVREDMDDPDAFEFFPGAKNAVADPQQVVMWSPDPTAATISLTAEQQLKSDLQAISGGAPWLSGDSQASNSDTATEASILTNLAQRRVLAKKQFFLEADARMGDQFIMLNDQFLTEPRYEQIVGADGQEGWELIDPESFRDYRFKAEVSSMDESLMRSERLAQAQAKFQIAMTAVPVFAAVRAAAMQSGDPAAPPALNAVAFMDDVLEAYGIEDKERYYSQPSQVPQPAAASPVSPPGGAAGVGEPPGATAPQAVDPNSPSNAFSQSPVAAQQRMGAMAGGPVNV